MVASGAAGAVARQARQKGVAMFRRILVPVDGSPCANRGLRVALDLARDQKAAIVLLHVVDETVVAQSMASVDYLSQLDLEAFIDALRQNGRKVLKRAEATLAKAGIDGKSVLCETMGRPVADIIVAQARKSRADVIVIGTHGRRGLARVVMGSDAEGVVRTSPVPVLLVRAPHGRRQR
jgi:nucleotide-binding universal stress UspA family protein